MLKSDPVSRICVTALGLFMAGVTGCGEGPSEASVAEKIKAAKNSAALAAPGDQHKHEEESNPVPSATGPWPKVFVIGPVFKFGTMRVGEHKSHDFVIKNEGEADLILKTGTTTCKCTRFGFGAVEETAKKDAVVKPGESITLTMNWNGGKVADRGFRHGGDLFTNDPKNTTLKLAVEGAVEMPYDVQPDIWAVGDIYEAQTAKLRATIGSKLLSTLEIESLKSPSGFVTLTPGPFTPEDLAAGDYIGGVSVNVEVSPSIPAGLFTEEVEIKLVQEPDPIKVLVTARKQGVIRLQPMAGTLYDSDKMQLRLGSFPASEGREATLLMVVDEKDMTEPLRITDVKADPTFVTASISPIGQPSGTVHRYLLKIVVPPGRPHVQRTESKPGQVAISTNHPSGETLSFGLIIYSN
jgi:hypothetical protein